MAKQAYVYSGTDWVPLASEVTNLTGYQTKALSQFPYRNLLINGAMQIAQRATSVASITGSLVVRAGGGGGGAYQGYTAGSGTDGGGNGGTSTGSGTAGTANTGSGGGGGGAPQSGTSGNGGAGGSGVVILKFLDTFTLTVGSGLTSSNTTSGGYKIYTFTAGTGTVTFS